MKRVTLFLLLFGITAIAPIFSQNRTVVVTSTPVQRTVLTPDSASRNGADIWKQLEQERIAAERAEQERIAAEKRAEQERIAAERAEQERIAAEKRTEQERIAAERTERERQAAAQRAEEARIAAEKKAEEMRKAAEAAERKRIADSIAVVQHAKELAIKTARRDSIQKARKERIASYPWTNMILLNGAYALYPEYAFGITYARVKQGGFYISAMMNPSFRFQADHEADSRGFILGVKPFYSGQRVSTRLSATIGTLVRMRAPIYFYAGAGYGYRGLFYETSNQHWVAWHTQSTVYHGMHWETGLIGNIKGFGISLGISSITDFSHIYYEGKLGLGYCF